MYRMTIQELQKFIDAIQLPILTSWGNPQQLYLYNWLDYVASYDPVYSIKIVGETIVIQGRKYEYEHNLSDFDSIKLEPYIED